MSSSGPARFRLLALSGSFCISFAAIFVRLADVSAATATLFRCLYAVPVLAILWWSSRAQDTRTRRNRLVGLSSGLLLAADLSLWHEAILRIGAGLATVLVNVQVVFVASLAWLLYGEQPSRFALVTVPLILGGVALVSGLGGGDAYGRDPAGGVVFGVLAGAAYAAYLLTFRAAQAPAAPAAGPLMEASLGAALGTSLVGPFVDPGFTWNVPLESHVWLLALGLLAQVAGWLLIGSALPRLPALETSVMLLAQPIATMLWGVVVFGEGASRTQMAGVALVLAGVGFLTVVGSVRPRSGDMRAASP